MEKKRKNIITKLEGLKNEYEDREAQIAISAFQMSSIVIAVGLILRAIFLFHMEVKV